MNCFTIFDLDPLSDAAVDLRVHLASPTTTQHIRRLARVLGLDAEVLSGEYSKHLVYAIKVYRSATVPDNLAAWREATDSDRASRRPKQLRSCLVRLAAWCPSSCGLERLFSTSMLIKGSCRGAMTDDNFEDELLLLCMKDEREWPQLFTHARELWLEFYGCSRRGHAQKRIGLRGPGAKSEVKLMQDRRATIGKFVAETPVCNRKAGPSAAGKRAWGAGHKWEEDFNITKYAKRFVQAVGDGHLLPDEYQCSQNQ